MNSLDERIASMKEKHNNHMDYRKAWNFKVASTPDEKREEARGSVALGLALMGWPVLAFMWFQSLPFDPQNVPAGLLFVAIFGGFSFIIGIAAVLAPLTE